MLLDEVGQQRAENRNEFGFGKRLAARLRAKGLRNKPFALNGVDNRERRTMCHERIQCAAPALNFIS